MSRSNKRNLQIKCLDNEAFNLHSVVCDPRSARPYDVKAACSNITISTEGKKPPLDVMSLAAYVLSGYFEYAHKSGLYNRQKDLWESLARLTSCNIEVVRSDGLVPIKLPAVDLHFLSHQGDLLLMARLVKPHKRLQSDRRSLSFLKSFISRLSKTKVKKRTLSGAFICYPEPIAKSVIQKMEAIAGKNDPVAKFESRLPMPAEITLNVLEMSYQSEPEIDPPSNGGAGDNRLIYPESQLLPIKLAYPPIREKR